MSLYYPDCNIVVADPVCTPCPTKELGDVRSIALVRKNFVFLDITDPTEWAAGVNARDIYLFPDSRGGVEFAERLEPGFGDVLETLDGYDITVTASDPNYLDNCNFWNDVKRFSNEFKIAYKTETRIHLTDVPATIIPKAPIEEDKGKRVTWLIMFKVTQEDIPCPFPEPVGTFDECIAVN